MKIFILTFGFFLLVIFGMAIGYIVKRRSIKGSCGGIAAMAWKKSAIAIRLVSAVALKWPNSKHRADNFTQLLVMDFCVMNLL